ncbi:hypothetical protein GBF38_011417 [Nibea albiflora]|uniref:Uncharacterized protein n=1 Tax=Nibea albiflora TaxID=240163 RepID=A0ACB7F4C8_NIBAL|nr:hypothetical protein GBF38_011417 [Nibea albiflora]
MNPADYDSIRNELRAQASALQHHDEQLTTISSGFEEMVARHERGLGSIQELLQRLHQPPCLNSDLTQTLLQVPASHSSCSGRRGSRIVQSLTFELQPSAFPTERSRVAYILLAGRARDWETAEWEKQSAICCLSSCSLMTCGREVAQGQNEYDSASPREMHLDHELYHEVRTELTGQYYRKGGGWEICIQVYKRKPKSAESVYPWVTQALVVCKDNKEFLLLPISDESCVLLHTEEESTIRPNWTRKSGELQYKIKSRNL